MLQAVEHSQAEPANPFETFVSELQWDQQRVGKLETDIGAVLRKLSTLELDRPRGFRDKVFTPSEVDRLLRTSYKLRRLGEGVDIRNAHSDVTIEIARDSNGSVVVFPATAAA